MAYTIPKTNKLFLFDNRTRPKVFKYEYKHTNNASYTETITNPNAYAIDCVVSMNAGSGDTNTATYATDKTYWNRNDWSAWLYTYAGRVGTNVNLKLNGKLLASSGGGKGTDGYQIAVQTGYQYQDSGDKNSTWTDWQYNGNQNKNARQEGECSVFVVTLPPNASLHIEFVYNNASNAPFKGSCCVSGYY